MAAPIPKVLVAAPTYNKGAKYLNKFVSQIKNLSYPNHEILLVDSSKNNDYFNTLKRIIGITVLKSEFIPDERGLENLAAAENKIRDYFLENDFDYWLSLEHDIIPPKDIIEKLMAANKSLVGAIYKIGGEWLVFKEFYPDGRFYRHEGIEKMAGLVKTWDCGLGCVLIKRKVLEQIKFHTGKFPYHPDYYFYVDVAQLNIPVYVLPEIKVEHLNEEVDQPELNLPLMTSPKKKALIKSWLNKLFRFD